MKMLREPIDRCYQSKVLAQPVLDGEHVIVVENLAVDYVPGEGKRRRALDGVSLQIRPGEIIGIAGRSGCGKSTFLRALLRLVHPCDGTAVVGGVPLDGLDRESMARLLGYVGQSPFVFSSSIEENIAYERTSPLRPAVDQSDRFPTTPPRYAGPLRSRDCEISPLARYVHDTRGRAGAAQNRRLKE